MILVPDLPDITTKATSNAEKKVARLLNQIGGDPNAVAFHSVHLRSHPRKQHAESDFIVLWRGILVVIEVKGGGISKRDGHWYSIDRYGSWHRLPESPMQQARSGMYGLRDILKEDGLGWFPHEALVITPDIGEAPQSIEYSDANWIAGESFTVAGLEHALDTLAASHRPAPHGARRASQTQLRQRLFGEFTRLPMVDTLRRAVLDEQSRATTEQAQFLAGMYANDRLMLLGGAGTGKTLALIEGAKQDASRGLRVLVTFYSHSLHQLFQTHFEGRRIDALPIDLVDSSQKYDVVFVDEAQDIMNAPMMDKLGAVLDDGLEKGRWRMFLDPNNQAQIDGLFDDETYGLMSSINNVRYNLSKNIRNTQAIVYTVQDYLGADIGDPGIVHGPRIEWKDCTLGDEKEARCVAEELIKNGISSEHIWLISCQDRIKNSLSVGNVRSLDARNAKGLEAPHVIIYNLPDLATTAGTAQFYVAVTRARFNLYILCTPKDRLMLKKQLKERMLQS